MNRIITIFGMIALLFTAVGCNKMVYYDQPFVCFLNSDATSIDCTAIRDVEYVVHLSSKKPSSPIDVAFSVVPGNGLTEGVDYKIITKGYNLKFLPGIYDLPIRISWMNNQIDKTKDNTLTIRLESTSDDNVLVGMPGPDARMREIKISKY